MAEALAKWFPLLVETFDFHRPSRIEWRGSFCGEQRPSAQQFLLQLAREARQGTQADQLALYKAAHAILPLHGLDLTTLTRLLLDARPVPLEWADVLVSALSESPPGGLPWTAFTLDALRELMERETTEQASALRGERLRMRSLLYQVLALGLQPAWLKAWARANALPVI